MFDFISSLLVSEAWAMGASPEGGQGGGSALTGFMPLIIIFVIFYFLLIRPQQKKAKDHRDMLAGVKKGDKVVTSGGIYGVVEDVSEKTVTLKIADNTKVKLGKAYIATIRTPSDEG